MQKLCQSNVKKRSVVMELRLMPCEYLLDRIKERAELHELHEGHYIPLKHRLEDCTSDSLSMKKAVWHCICYNNATSKVKIQLVND